MVASLLAWMTSVTFLLTHSLTADVAWVKVAGKDLFVITWKNLSNQNFALERATIFMTKTRTLVSTFQPSPAFLKAKERLVPFGTQNTLLMLARQVKFYCSVTETLFFAFPGTRVATFQYFFAIAFALVVDRGVFETRHTLFMSTWKSFITFNIATCCARATTYVFTLVATVESFLASDLTYKIFGFSTTLYCLFVATSRNNLHHRTCTETVKWMMTTPLTMMVIGAAFPTHLWTSTWFMKFICRMTVPVAGMTTFKTYSTEFVTTTQGKVLDVTRIFYLVGIVVPLANQC